MGSTHTHPFVASEDNPKVCGHPLADSSGFAGGICGFPAANRRVHAPGAVARPRLAVVRRDSAAVASGAPATSVAAALRTLPSRGSLRWQIVEMLTHPTTLDQGLTDDEVEQITGKAHTSVSSARRSLVLDGLVEALVVEGESITRLTKASGSPAQAWVLTTEGLAAYQAERVQASA